MSPTKKILIAAGVLLVVLIAVMALASNREDGVEVETSEAVVRSITQTVTASGRVASEIEVAISSDVSGEIVQLMVAEGDRVQQGQLLLRIRPDQYASERDRAQASVAAARSGVASAQQGVVQAQADAAQATADRERAERALARQQDLFNRGVASAADLDAARGAFDVARAAEASARQRIGGAQAQVARARQDVAGAQVGARQAGQQLAQTAIYAPMSGTVSQLNVELGERIVGTATMNGTELMRIARLDAMTMEIDVNENDVVQVELGDSAHVEIDAYPDEPLPAVVSEIANAARIQNAGSAQAVTSFPVTVRLAAAGDDAEATTQAGRPVEGSPPRATGLRLRPGMSGTVDIVTRTIPEAVVVPIQAVTVRDFNEIQREARRTARAKGEDIPDTPIPDEEDLRRIVFVVVDGKAVMREVETGISDDTHIEIRRGLRGGETVVTGPFQRLRTELDDGDTVREADDLASDDDE